MQKQQLIAELLGEHVIQIFLIVPSKVDCPFRRSSLKGGFFMDWAPKVLSFLISGTQSNWWGLACPSHCFASGLASLSASFLIGFLLGILLTASFCLWGLGFLPASVPSPGHLSAGQPPAPDRVRAYLNEQSLTTFPRRRRGTFSFPGVSGAADLDQGQR